MKVPSTPWCLFGAGLTLLTIAFLIEGGIVPALGVAGSGLMMGSLIAALVHDAKRF